MLARTQQFSAFPYETDVFIGGLRKTRKGFIDALSKLWLTLYVSRIVSHRFVHIYELLYSLICSYEV